MNGEKTIYKMKNVLNIQEKKRKYKNIKYKIYYMLIIMCMIKIFLSSKSLLDIENNMTEIFIL